MLRSFLAVFAVLVALLAPPAVASAMACGTGCVAVVPDPALLGAAAEAAPAGEAEDLTAEPFLRPQGAAAPAAVVGVVHGASRPPPSEAPARPGAPPPRSRLA